MIEIYDLFKIVPFFGPPDIHVHVIEGNPDFVNKLSMRKQGCLAPSSPSMYKAKNRALLPSILPKIPTMTGGLSI